MTNLYFIRHAQAVGNVNPIITGDTSDQGLTPKGVKQAERLRHRLATFHEIRADLILSSRQPRARQTAELIAPALEVPIQFHEGLEKINMGIADGMLISDAHAQFGQPDFRANPFKPISPGGENWGQFMLRIATMVDSISREYHHKSVVIICHGSVIDASFLYFLRTSTLISPFWISFYTHHTSITHWEQISFDRQQCWRLHTYNDIGHLLGTDISNDA